MHTKEILKLNETQQRIFLISAWKETSFFTEQEKAVLALTEEVTLIHQNGLTEETYRNAQNFFREHIIGKILMQISIRNVWNRIAVSMHEPFAD